MPEREQSPEVAPEDNPLKKQRTTSDAKLLQRSESTVKGKFKILGHLVLAAKRFQASLNPSYTYGKRQEEDAQGPQSPARTTGPTTRSMSNRSNSGRTLSGRPTARPGSSHGHKGALLFKPLAPVGQEA